MKTASVRDLRYDFPRVEKMLVFLLLSATCIAQSPLAPDFLAAHNNVRASVRVAPLKWSDRLAAVAQDWAEALLLRKQLLHRPGNQYGENIFDIRGAPASPQQVVDTWASEAADYDYASNKCRKVCGHYTQIVWGDTKELGCAVTRDARREVWVCNYNPPGNYIGKRPY